MRWFRRKPPATPVVENDGMTPGPYAAYWWRPGCTCHWSAGVDCDYCDFCKAGRSSSGNPTSPASTNAEEAESGTPRPDAANTADAAELTLYGVTHFVRVRPVDDDRWDYMLTVSSLAGEGQALLTPDDCYRLRDFLLNGRDPGPGQYVDPRCRCTGEPHELYGDDCMKEQPA